MCAIGTEREEDKKIRPHLNYREKKTLSMMVPKSPVRIAVGLEAIRIKGTANLFTFLRACTIYVVFNHLHKIYLLEV